MLFIKILENYEKISDLVIPLLGVVNSSWKFLSIYYMLGNVLNTIKISHLTSQKLKKVITII